MKVYQCIRAYDAYIPSFEEKYKVNDTNYTFKELRNLLIQDGFASLYILEPAFNNDENFFFTFWNYKTLQFKWAEENNLKTDDLDEIRIAQVELFKPDVYYNFSSYYDNDKLKKILNKKDILSVCWDATIGSYTPPLHENYKLRVTLFEPYVKYWNQRGFNSLLLAPAIPDSWQYLPMNEKEIDILFYGQVNEFFFSERNQILEKLIKWNKKKEYNLKLYLQLPRYNRPLINIGRFKKYARWLPPTSRIVLEKSHSPIYGQVLYETIARSKIVINAFGNFNGMYKENMRNYESTGCGALLIGEDGIYPDFLVPGKDLFTFRTHNELFDTIDYALSHPELISEISINTKLKMQSHYSKHSQWMTFLNAINS